mmetsp:Transcript_56947/g.83341  ORF Transcript_56947/g.83341 Transcript_56947/m.83341 type:complete len:209 (+) Transcript_56947:259-885(+)
MAPICITALPAAMAAANRAIDATATNNQRRKKRSAGLALQAAVEAAQAAAAGGRAPRRSAGGPAAGHENHLSTSACEGACRRSWPTAAIEGGLERHRRATRIRSSAVTASIRAHTSCGVSRRPCVSTWRPMSSKSTSRLSRCVSTLHFSMLRARLSSTGSTSLVARRAKCSQKTCSRWAAWAGSEAPAMPSRPESAWMSVNASAASAQ